MRAPKLQAGDEIRVISPSRSMSITAPYQRVLAQERLEALGFKVTFGKHVLETDDFASSSIASRIEDLHDAFLDPNVKGILTTIGGFNCNQLLNYIDYDMIANNPKRLCGYSDITALNNAILAKTGLISYSGPHFSTLGMLHGNEYTIEYFEKLMMQEGELNIAPPSHWSDDQWYRDQENRIFVPNEGPYVINEGEASGTIIGGNQCTFNLLHGTAYMPSLAGTILFVEDDSIVSPVDFDRDLQSILHQPGFDQVKGLVIGRFQRDSEMTRSLLTQIIHSKRELAGIPVVADVEFGHTTPRITIPIGGQASIKAFDGQVKLTISE
ncbi:LD-carboxypeptidase [Paenibacillus albiflavus]|uniref:LD-carboxypeptidase n=1 Tax=Paenibacillus albiflavus TaxID=2545760 RepID=A0A4R4ENA3_9BACL|nr:S66 peptidase family protein [Paenibacillus albiflavus]TCZ79895.1 LD-carboxypeptidase [Paenibacillus albiflavus]